MFHNSLRIAGQSPPVGYGRPAMADTVMKPTEEISVREMFGIDTDMKVKGFAEATDRVPAIDPTYKLSLIHI